MRNYQAVFIVGGLLVATSLFSYFFFRVPSKSSDSTFNNEFSLVLKNYGGKDVPLYSYRRQIIVAYAWASWCPYCAGEMQALATLKKTYGDKIQILAINRAEPVATAKAFTDGLGIEKDIDVIVDPKDKFFKSIGGYAMPETVFINANGDIVYHQRGPIDVPTLEAKLKELVH